MRLLILVLLGLACGAAFGQERFIEATTSTGEKVRLLPSGRWEYADERKAEGQRKAAEAEKARERAAQGTLLGIGRPIYEGDKDYNRGTLNPRRP